MSIFDALKSLFGGKSANGAADSTNGAGSAGMSGDDMISCEDALNVLYEFLDGELEDASSQRVQAHFDVCSRCYPNLRFEESFRDAVQRASRGATAPPELRARLMEAIAETGDG